MSDPIARLVDLVRESTRAVVFTGAGMSTESGIPDFRSPGGLWTRMKPIQFQDFVSSPDIRREAWQRRFSGDDLLSTAEPNEGHRNVAALVAAGKVSCVITQNIDGLHEKGGVPREKIIEIHGNGTYCTCLSCGRRYELSFVRQVLAQSGDPPDCGHCGGIIKAATISFGQAMPEREMELATAETLVCDLFIAMGSSLVVYPAAGFPLMARRNGAKLVILNREATELDSQADLVIHGEIGPSLKALGDAISLDR